jgi:endonuclease/exonuclease/phosphatase family metal-dependent hydrolase
MNHPDRIRIATYNIHKGVQGMGLRQRLEIHNLGLAVEQFDADIVCLQEVRSHHRQLERRFSQWPSQPQADFLAPEGYHAVYRTNAITRYGEHGNAVLSRWPVVRQAHHDVSDHRFEQRGVLHVELLVQGRPLHVMVVHLGLMGGSRRRQVTQIVELMRTELPADDAVVVAGDFNDWADQLHAPLRRAGLVTFEALRLPTFPARAPLLHLDRIYARGLLPLTAQVPRGRVWARMSDHLPLIGELSWPPATPAGESRWDDALAALPVAEPAHAG